VFDGAYFLTRDAASGRSIRSALPYYKRAPPCNVVTKPTTYVRLRIGSTLLAGVSPKVGRFACRASRSVPSSSRA
jgi:hypothetical protein